MLIHVDIVHTSKYEYICLCLLYTLCTCVCMHHINQPLFIQHLLQLKLFLYNSKKEFKHTPLPVRLIYIYIPKA